MGGGGLLPEPPRRDSGYGSTDRTPLELAEGGPESCEAAQEVAWARIAELDRRIADLVAMRGSLERLVATCALPREVRECPLLKALDKSRGEDDGQ